MKSASPFTLVIAAIAVAGLAGGACSSDDAEPGLDRIDGPAQVDPDVEIGGSTGDTDG